MTTISIPRINDDPRDFDTLFSIWKACQDPQHIDLDFANCDFLKQNAVAFLGGMIAHIKSEGRSVFLRDDTLSPALRRNLEQNGFLYEMGLDVPPWDGNSVPYRHDRQPDMDTISRYLREKWIGRGWLNIHPNLTEAVVCNVLEIYSNAFTHGYSPIGVYSCGQRYRKLKKLKFTAIDFGIGIPRSVRQYLQSTGKPYAIPDDTTLQMAFREGFSTRPGLGGLGLKLLKEFIHLNNGRLDIYSHSGHAIIDAAGERYEMRGTFFQGTVVNITINIDQKFYYLSTESSNQTPF